MKRIKRNCLLFFVAIVLLLSGLTIQTNAYGKEEHNDFLEQVLFGEMGYSGAITNETTNTIYALEWASYLAIDQARPTEGATELANLRALHIPNLPKSVADFSLSNIFYGSHRKYTHKGWDYTYENENDPAKWVKIRKNILLSTVNKRFNFGIFSSKLFGYDDKCNSFAALIYYVHLLGDHIYDAGEYDENIMIIGNTDDDQNVIDELEKHIKLLFANTKNKNDLGSLMNELSDLNREIEKVQFQMKDLSDSEKSKKYEEISKHIMDVLIEYVPLLLKEEKFFKEVFYPD